MLSRQTEKLPDHPAIDALNADMAVTLMLDGQVAAVKSVRDALSEIGKAARIMADTIRTGGTLIYTAAGSSGLMALADVCELPGTFGIAPGQLRLHMAGGVPADAQMPGATEDDTDETDVLATRMTHKDCLIALSASGSTPYPIAIAEKAAARGAKVIAIANNPDTPLLNIADIAICLPTPPEVLAGSTRLGAGTAQKVALNIMSTQMGVLLGHVYQGRMVNLIADNAKLRARAATIVSDITHAAPDRANTALERAGGNVKLAILIAQGFDATDARAALARTGGQLGPLLTPDDQNQ